MPFRSRMRLPNVHFCRGFPGPAHWREFASDLDGLGSDFCGIVSKYGTVRHNLYAFEVDTWRDVTLRYLQHLDPI